jgi:hypothetical protein
MTEYRAEDTPAQRLRLSARAALLRVYMKDEVTHAVELEELVRWFAQNEPDHSQYQAYLNRKRQQYQESLRAKRQPKTLLGKLLRRRTII